MAKLSVSQMTTLRWNMEEELAAYRHLGFDAVGIYRPKLEDVGIGRARRLLQQYRMQVSSLSWAGGFTGSDGRGYVDAVHDGIEAVHTANSIGAETLIVLAGGRNNHIRGHAKKTLIKGLQEIACEAAPLGINVALEAIHTGCGAEWSFLNDICETLEIIRDESCRDVSIVLDTYHQGLDDEVLDWLPELIPHLALVQVGDGRQIPRDEMNRCLLGEGRVPLRAMFDMLGDHGYDGFYELELLGLDVERLEYPEILTHSRQFLRNNITTIV
ncbi:MAG: sugar phosphate isomerase/epimerase family protein [Planctomycetota bacterium]